MFEVFGFFLFRHVFYAGIPLVFTERFFVALLGFFLKFKIEKTIGLSEKMVDQFDTGILNYLIKKTKHVAECFSFALIWKCRNCSLLYKRSFFTKGNGNKSKTNMLYIQIFV